MKVRILVAETVNKLLKQTEERCSALFCVDAADCVELQTFAVCRSSLLWT